jgi:hypothetical protein
MATRGRPPNDPNKVKPEAKLKRRARGRPRDPNVIRKPKHVFVTTELDEYRRLFDIMTILVAQLHNENCEFIKRVPYYRAVNINAMMKDLIKLCKLMKIQCHKTLLERQTQFKEIHAESHKQRSARASKKILETPEETCVHCGRTMQMQNYFKWHGDRCKLNPNRVVPKKY